MTQLSPLKMFLILLVCVYGILYSIPNFVSTPTYDWMEDNLPAWMPKKSVNLGLDLRGGAHLLYEVNLDQVFSDRANSLEQDIKERFRNEKIEFTSVTAQEKGVAVEIKNVLDAENARKFIRGIDSGLVVESASDNSAKIAVTMDENYIKTTEDHTIAQVIEVVRRRVDEMGTTEPVIQRQGKDRVIIQVPGANSEDLRRLVGKTAKLGFHLVNEEGGGFGDLNLPTTENPDYKISVKRRALITGDMLETAQPTMNSQTGRPVVSFGLNGVGARKFCDISRNNVNKRFAIVLDNEIISAPVINEPICGGNGQISGGFDVQQATDLALLLRAGALPAEMTVVEERSVGPSLGADSVEAGKKASIAGMLFVLFFMAINYGTFGLLANIALFINVALIIALLSSLQATLTLPGIAGIVLTIGMAVDANVLIYERIREELEAGRSAISSIDAGFRQAMSTIIDSNMTTLIAAAILFSFGTGPIKGFAVTLSIGILTSMFSAIFITRLFIVIWLGKKRKLTTLPI